MLSLIAEVIFDFLSITIMVGLILFLASLLIPWW